MFGTKPKFTIRLVMWAFCVPRGDFLMNQFSDSDMFHQGSFFSVFYVTHPTRPIIQHSVKLSPVPAGGNPTNRFRHRLQKDYIVRLRL